MDMTIKPVRLLLLAVASALAGAAPPPAPAPASAPVVHISNFRFGPQTVTVAAGATITWINDDDEPHTVTASDRSYRSALLNPGGRYTRQYPTPGEYAYFCSLHPHMTGRIVVVRR
jgi:plastocyanin